MKRLFLLALAATLTLISGCQTCQCGGAQISKAIAVIYPTAGNETMGFVTFTQESEGVRVQATVTGLTPGKHGFHIHQYGDMSRPDGKSAGGHFNPNGVPHGEHVGDLGNLEANSDGYAYLDIVDKNLKFNGATSIIGRGLIVHAGPDDLVSQPSGAAGARVGHGVIGVAKPE